MSEDQLLIQRLVNGDQQALEELMERYQHYVYTILSSMLHDHEAAEASQDTFIKVYRGINRFEQNAKLTTWIYKIAYRTGLDYLKKRRRHTSFDDVDYDLMFAADAQIEGRLDRVDLNNSIVYLLKQLKADEAAILRLFYFYEMNIHEVSEITSLSVSNVKVKLHRSRLKMKELIEKNKSFNFKEYIGQ